MLAVKDIQTVLIAGAGIMGASFAQIFSANGYDVILYDVFDTALDTAKHLIEVNQRAQIEKGRITAAESKAAAGRIAMTTSGDCFAEADFIIEAIAEKMEIKHRFWREVSAAAKPEAILATNTSGLSISEIAEAVSDPSRFAGMHWVNPPHLIPLVEVIAGAKSSRAVVDAIYELAEHIHQKPVRVYKDPVGFILNRLQYAVIREACNCVDQGYASIEDVDNVMKYGLGMRYACIGPFETMDFGNIETFHTVANYIYKDLNRDACAPRLLEDAFAEGKLGVKNGRGFYDYSGEKAEKALAARDAKFIAVADALFGDERD